MTVELRQWLPALGLALYTLGTQAYRLKLEFISPIIWVSSFNVGFLSFNNFMSQFLIKKIPFNILTYLSVSSLLYFSDY